MDNNITKNWKTLFKIGGIAAFLIVAFTFIQMFIYFTWPPPTSVTGWFQLYHESPLIGLLDMDLLLMVDYLLLVPVYLALFVLLFKSNKSLTTLALVTSLLSCAIYFASSAAFEMLTLSNKYFAATSESQKAMFQSAGELLYITWKDGTAFNVSYILGALAALLYSLVMLKSTIFSKKTAYLGVFMSILMFVPPTIGLIGIVFSIVSIIPMDIWLVLVGRRLLLLKREEHDLK